MPKIRIERIVEESLKDFNKRLVLIFKEYTGRKLTIRKINKIFKKNLKLVMDKSTLELEVTKKCGFFTRLFLNIGIISRETPYFWWYHLFFPTLRKYEKDKTNFSYVIDDENIHRYILSYTDGSKVIFRFKHTYDMILEKLSYRFIEGYDDE